MAAVLLCGIFPDHGLCLPDVSDTLGYNHQKATENFNPGSSLPFSPITKVAVSPSIGGLEFCQTLDPEVSSSILLVGVSVSFLLASGEGGAAGGLNPGAE